jgi:hypothetical protein
MLFYPVFGSLGVSRVSSSPPAPSQMMPQICHHHLVHKIWKQTIKTR